MRDGHGARINLIMCIQLRNTSNAGTLMLRVLSDCVCLSILRKLYVIYDHSMRVIL